MDEIRIILADDHQLFRNGIRMILEKEPLFKVIDEAADGLELMELLKKHDPHVVLIDLSMPGKTGLEVMEECKTKYPDIKFIVLTMHSDGQYVAKSVRSGAKAYLLKNTDEEELTTAIREVLFGRKYFNQEISQLLINNMAIQESDFKRLSQRETEVLQLVAEGKITKEIADELCVSTRTVETHRVNMMKKLKASNTAELIKKAKDLDII